MEKFFSHEILSYLPKNAELQSGDKLQLVKYLNQVCNDQVEVPKVSAGILEGSALVNMSNPNKNEIFQSYCTDIVNNAINKYTNEYNPEQIDIVFGTLKKESLKFNTRPKCRKGVRRKVQADNIAPTNWCALLRIAGNKVELFPFIPK